MFQMVGFAIKTWPWQGPFNIDSAWDPSEEIEAYLLSTGMASRNDMWLLETATESEFRSVIDYVDSQREANLVGVKINSLLAEHMRSIKRIGKYVPSEKAFDGIHAGYDVVDAYGLFTFLNHPIAIKWRKTEQLFLPNQLEIAHEFQELAAYVAPEHAPYVVASVYLHKSC